MKFKVTYVTGQAPNLPWSRICTMTDNEIKAYNDGFYHRETVEFDDTVTRIVNDKDIAAVIS